MVSVTKMAKVAGLTTTTLAALIGFCLRADAQSLPLSGKIISASSVSGNNIFTTPQSGTKFVLTQWCVELKQVDSGVGSAVLTGSTFGFIAEIQGLYSTSGNPGKAACVSFSPGYVMPLRESISCSVQPVEPSTIGVTCSISGVLSTTLP